MSDRAPGYYWVRTYGAGVPEIAEWRSRGILGGYEWASERREDIAERDIVVLAGPLQAPSESDSVRIGNVVLDPQKAALDEAERTLAGRWAHQDRVWAVAALIRRVAPAAHAAGKRHALDDLRTRARALLEGTTPGPRELVGNGTEERPAITAPDPVGGPDCGVEVSARADSFNGNDLAYILGVHELLTELAKEEA